jgi:molybdopterin converting factor small subunit
MATVVVRYWAGAQRAAGHAEEPLSAATIGELRESLSARRELRNVCAAASFLVDGAQATEGTVLHDGAVVDVLPPFAGG